VATGELAGRSAAKALTKHVCIDAISRTKKQLSEDLMQWMSKFES